MLFLIQSGRCTYLRRLDSANSGQMTTWGHYVPTVGRKFWRGWEVTRRIGLKGMLGCLLGSGKWFGFESTECVLDIWG
jgi:hypothetical protein